MLRELLAANPARHQAGAALVLELLAAHPEWQAPLEAACDEPRRKALARLQAKLGVGPFWTPLYGAPPAPRALTQVCVHMCVFSVCLGLTQYVCVVVMLAL